MKKERNHPERLTARERNRLLAFRHRENTGEVTCLVCHYKMREAFPVPHKEMAEDTTGMSTEDNKKKKKKKKKKSEKEVNAGLLLPSKTLGPETEDGGRTSHTLESTCVGIANQGTPSQKKYPSGRKRFEKISKEGQFVNKRGDSEKLPSNRTDKNLPTSRHAVSAGLHSSGLQPPQNLTTSHMCNFKVNKFRQKKLFGLGNVMSKEVAKNSEKDQNASLEDFLNTLF